MGRPYAHGLVETANAKILGRVGLITHKGNDMNQQLPLAPIIYLSFVLSLVGCVHSTVQIKDAGDLPANERVTLVTDSKNVTIEKINRETVTTLRQLWDNKWDADVILRPGEYEIEVKYWNGPTFNQHIVSRYLFKLVGVAGHTYQLKHRLSGRSAKVWIEDVDTGQYVGRIIASLNESVDDPTETIDHSIYFTMSPPQGSDWIIANRNPRAINFAKQGKNIDETYAAHVYVVDLPNMASKDEFFKYMKAEIEKDTDLERFTPIKNNYSYFEGRGDYCINYYSLAEDKKAQKRSNKKDSMLLEVVGYFCRQPRNKNIVIVFGYSHRYYDGNQDEKLSEKASAAFEKLKF